LKQTRDSAEATRDTLDVQKRRTDSHSRAIYGLVNHNFDPYDYTSQKNSVARNKYLDDNHKHRSLKEAYKAKTANYLITQTVRHALTALNMHMPLRAAMLGWDMTKVLKAVMIAVGITHTSMGRAADDAKTDVEQRLRGHKIDDHRLRLTAQEGRGTRSRDAIWLLPPPWPMKAAGAWLGPEGLADVLALATTDLANRLKEPREAEDGKDHRVVWLPGQATYMHHLHRLRNRLNAKCEGRTQDIPHEIKKAFRYFSLRAGVDEQYTVTVEGDLATIAIQKAREAAASDLLREEALQKARTANDEQRKAAQAQMNAETRTQRLIAENSRLRGERKSQQATIDDLEEARKTQAEAGRSQAEIIRTMAATIAELAAKQNGPPQLESTFTETVTREVEKWVIDLKGGVHFILSGWVATLKIALRAACIHPGRWVEFVSKKSVTDILAELKDTTAQSILDGGGTVTINKAGVLYTTRAQCDTRTVGASLAAARQSLTLTHRKAWDAAWNADSRKSKRQIIGVYASFQIVQMPTRAMKLADGSDDPVYTMFGEPAKNKYKYACFLNMIQLNIDIRDKNFRAPAIPQGVSMRKGEFPAGPGLSADIAAAIWDRMSLQRDGTFKMDLNEEWERPNEEESPGAQEGSQEEDRADGTGSDTNSDTDAEPSSGTYQDDMPHEVKKAFEDLGVAVGSSREVAKQAYNRRAKELHPDKNPGPDSEAANKRFIDLNDSWETLRRWWKPQTAPEQAEDRDAPQTGSPTRIRFPRAWKTPIIVTERAWRWAQALPDARAPGELIDMILGVMQAKIEDSDPDNEDILHVGPSQALRKDHEKSQKDYEEALNTIMDGRSKAFAMIPVQARVGSWAVIVICNKSTRTGREAPHILVARDQNGKKFAETKHWIATIKQAIRDSGGGAATHGQIKMRENATTGRNRDNSWIRTIDSAEAVVLTHHQRPLEGRHCILQAPPADQAREIADMQARLRAIDDEFGPLSQDRTAAEGTRSLRESFGVTLSEADVESMADGEPITNGVMRWGVRMLRHRYQTEKVWVCEAMLGCDIIAGKRAAELLSWHQCWADKDGAPAMDYTKPRFVLMPVKNDHLGWFLLILCHLTAQRADKFKPCALILDPRNTTKCKGHTDAVAAVSAYIQEWRGCTWNEAQVPLTAEWLKAPQTKTEANAGIMVLHMIDLFLQQHDRKLLSGRAAPYGPFGSKETTDYTTWFEPSTVVGAAQIKAGTARATPRTTLLKATLKRMMMTSVPEDAKAEEEVQDNAAAWTEQVTAEPGAVVHEVLMSILGKRVNDLMTKADISSSQWSENGTRKQSVPTEVAKAVNHALQTTLSAKTWGGIGCNRTHALEGRGTFRVCSWVLAQGRSTGPAGWTLPTSPKSCPAALWVINMALSPAGRYTVSYDNGISENAIELQEQGEVCTFQGKHLDAGRIALRTQGDTRLVMLCVGLAWNKPLTVLPGERWDDHDPHSLRLIIDQEGEGNYSRDRYGLGEGPTQRVRTGRRVCPRCSARHRHRQEVMTHFHSSHVPEASPEGALETYTNEMQEYWEWRRFDAVARRILHVERECGVVACCPTLKRPEAPRPACLQHLAEPHAIFEEGIKIGDSRRPARYLFRQGIKQQDILEARELVNSEEGRSKESPIHDKSGELGDTVRIIPYADDQAMEYINGRSEDDARRECVLHGEDTETRRRELHGRIVDTIKALARKVGETVELRGFMEFLISKSGAKGQEWHLDVYRGGWSFTWRIQGHYATRFLEIPYQGFPDYLCPDRSTLTANWTEKPDAGVVWLQEGDVSMFRADAPHAGPANPGEEQRIAGFIPEVVAEDADDFVITEETLFAHKTAHAELPHDAPQEVRKALEAALCKK
jgi:hypothetical protein